MPERAARRDTLSSWLRAVEIGFAKVEQRIERLERAILPSGEPVPGDE